MTNQRIFIIIGAILLVAAGAMKFGLSSQFNQRFPIGYSWELNTLGLNSFADEETGTFPEGTTLADDPVTNNLREVTATDAGNGQVLIQDRYVVHNATTGAIDWEFTTEATVDAETGRYLDGPNEGNYYFIPRNAEKITYTVSNSTYDSIEMAFVGEETVLGMDTYKYAYSGELLNTVAYKDYGFELTDEQPIICFDFTMEYWVEPLTGEVVQYRDWCEGDYAVDSDGSVMFGIQRWGSESTPDDLLKRIDIVNSNLTSYNLMNLYIPMILAVLGVLAIGAAVLPNLLQSNKADKGEAPA